MQNPVHPLVATLVTTAYSSPWWEVEEHAVVDPDGVAGMYNVLRCGDGVSILATAGDDYYLIREYKYAITRHILQLPSGGVDKDEEPLEAAARELLEETGLAADSWTPLGLIYPYPTNVAAAVHLFVAHDAYSVGAPEPGIELLRMSQAAVRDLVAKNEVTHAASLVCLLTHMLGGGEAR